MKVLILALAALFISIIAVIVNIVQSRARIARAEAVFHEQQMLLIQQLKECGGVIKTGSATDGTDTGDVLLDTGKGGPNYWPVRKSEDGSQGIYMEGGFADDEE